MKNFEVTYCIGEASLCFSVDLDHSIKNSIYVLFDVEDCLKVDGLTLNGVTPDNMRYYEEEDIEFVYTQEIEILFIYDFDSSESIRMFFKSLIDGNAFYYNLKHVYLIGSNGEYKRESLYDNLINFYEVRRWKFDHKVLDGKDSIKEIGTNLVFCMRI